MSDVAFAPPPTDVVKRADRPRFAWPEELLALLGKVSDVAIAAKAGLCTASAARERRRRRIAPFRPQRSDFEWSPEMVALLGTDTDSAVARALEIPAQLVSYKRTVLGIPGIWKGKKRAVNWGPEELALLGKLFDQEVAELMGVSTPTVARKRGRLEFRPAVVLFLGSTGLKKSLS